MPTPRSELAIGLLLTAVFALGGASMVATGTYIYRERTRLLSAGQAAEGTIVRFARIGPGPDQQLSDKWRVPVVEFETKAGETITVRADTSTPWWADYDTGQALTVVSDPADPSSARIDTFSELWFAPFMLWLVGGGAIFIPGLTMWRYLRR